MFNLDEFMKNIIYLLPAIVIALSAHEFAHAFVAYKLGDISQRERGRLSLNPLKHLDPFGTICLFLFQFGWAKPVQIDTYYFKNKKEGMIWSAIAGPLVNLILGFVFIFIFFAIQKFVILNFNGNQVWNYLLNLANWCAMINIGLGVFNLIPLPPLDGSKILIGILPEETYFKILQYEQILSIVLLMALVSGLFDQPLMYARGKIVEVFCNIAIFLLGMG